MPKDHRSILVYITGARTITATYAPCWRKQPNFASWQSRQTRLARALPGTDHRENHLELDQREQTRTIFNISRVWTTYRKQIAELLSHERGLEWRTRHEQSLMYPVRANTARLIARLSPLRMNVQVIIISFENAALCAPATRLSAYDSYDIHLSGCI